MKVSKILMFGAKIGSFEGAICIFVNFFPRFNGSGKEGKCENVKIHCVWAQNKDS